MTAAVDVLDEIVALTMAGAARLGEVRLVALDGPSGSGKTTLAARLLERFPCSARVLATDHLATWENPFNWWPVLDEQVLGPLAQGRPGRMQGNRWQDGSPVPGDWITVEPTDVLILEGVSSARMAVANRLTTAVWVELPDSGLRWERAVARDGESCREPLRQWQRDEQEFFEGDGTRARADVTIMVPA